MLLSNGGEIPQFPLHDHNLYINDVLQQVTIYENRHSYLPESSKDFVPLKATFEAMGYSVEFKDSNSIIIRTENYNIYMRAKDATIDYTFFENDDYSFLDRGWTSRRVPMEYIKVDGEIYYPLYEFTHIIDCRMYRNGSDIYLDSSKYYNENHVVYKNIGRNIDVDVYFNNVKADTSVFENTKDSLIEGDYLSSFLLLRPFFESINQGVEFISPNIICVTDNDSKYTFKAKAVIAGEDEILFEDGDDDCYIINGRTYISFIRIGYGIDGSIKQKNPQNLYLYSNEFVRTDIPTTLQEAYTFFGRVPKGLTGMI